MNACFFYVVPFSAFLLAFFPWVSFFWTSSVSFRFSLFWPLLGVLCFQIFVFLFFSRKEKPFSKGFLSWLVSPVFLIGFFLFLLFFLLAPLAHWLERLGVFLGLCFFLLFAHFDRPSLWFLKFLLVFLIYGFFLPTFYHLTFPSREGLWVWDLMSAFFALCFFWSPYLEDQEAPLFFSFSPVFFKGCFFLFFLAFKFFFLRNVFALTGGNLEGPKFFSLLPLLFFVLLFFDTLKFLLFFNRKSSRRTLKWLLLSTGLRDLFLACVLIYRARLLM